MLPRLHATVARRALRCKCFHTASILRNNQAPVVEAKKNDYFEKYQQKLVKKAQSEGLKDAQDLLKKHEDAQRKASEERIKKWKEFEQQALKAKEDEEKNPETSNTQKVRSSAPELQGLNKIMKVDMLANESPENITEIWNHYHSKRDGFISGVMTGDFYKKFSERAKTFPFFVLPIPRDSGYEFFFMQVAKGNLYFTPLLEYKTKQEHARPHLVLNHFDEFADSKGIVLMNGEIFSKVLKPDDAKILVYLTQMFYVTGSARKLQLLEDFHLRPSEFDFQASPPQTIVAIH
ncbi:hypothetical protein HDU97_006022 [Phlyctochytrium planicorne]|nr:hypothetical protein HDU97_006022 [Phlyctochytrium planicorne]